ncbi:hypothetical protein EGW08_005665 [Elysia chlorotica]|uniref:Uncharacterized protein n=1 Tax=Elysia chlorotica TaxID=188477 RepID=A0A3S1C9G4_ELYCH|nr:hypothetical protein EGW08_005665 [Elysia chlorotica]
MAISTNYYPYTVSNDDLVLLSYGKRRVHKSQNEMRVKICLATLLLSVFLLQTISYVAVTWPTPIRERRVLARSNAPNPNNETNHTKNFSPAINQHVLSSNISRVDKNRVTPDQPFYAQFLHGYDLRLRIKALYPSSTDRAEN